MKSCISYTGEGIVAHCLPIRSALASGDYIILRDETFATRSIVFPCHILGFGMGRSIKRKSRKLAIVRKVWRKHANVLGMHKV